MATPEELTAQAAADAAEAERRREEEMIATLERGIVLPEGYGQTPRIGSSGDTDYAPDETPTWQGVFAPLDVRAYQYGMDPALIALLEERVPKHLR